MNFAWLHYDIANHSELNFAKNITEYITIELLGKGHTVSYCYSETEANNFDMYAKIGTLFHDDVYKNSVKNINESEFVLFTPDKLIDKASYINYLLNPQKHFVDNTENLNDFAKNNGKQYDVIVCTSGGVTPLKVPVFFNLTKNATILVADYSVVSLNICRKIIDQWDMTEDLNEFINKHKVIDDERLYLGKYSYLGELKKHTNYKFMFVDLFDINSVNECLKKIEGKTGLWLASNVFNYITTSMIYDVSTKHQLQQRFINTLANDGIEWDIGLNTAGSGVYKCTPAKTLNNLTVHEGLKILPWLKT